MKKVNISDIQEVGVSHNHDIMKKVLIDKGEIPQLMTFGQAIFKPGQSVDEHKHETMFEVFLIESGKAIFVVKGEKVELETGDCLTIEPNELHSQSNPYDEDVRWLYFGIATD